MDNLINHNLTEKKNNFGKKYNKLSLEREISFLNEKRRTENNISQYINKINKNINLVKTRNSSLNKIQKKRIFSPLTDNLNFQKSQINIYNMNLNRIKSYDKIINNALHLSLNNDLLKNKLEKKKKFNHTKSYSLDKNTFSNKYFLRNFIEKKERIKEKEKKTGKNRKGIKNSMIKRNNTSINKEYTNEIKKKKYEKNPKKFSGEFSINNSCEKLKENLNLNDINSENLNFEKNLTPITKEKEELEKEILSIIKSNNDIFKEEMHFINLKNNINFENNILLNSNQKLTIISEKKSAEESIKTTNSNQNFKKLNVHEINENNSKFPLIQFNLFNLYFKSRSQIKENLIQILNNLKIKFRNDKKNKFKFFCEKKLFFIFEVSIIQSYLNDASILKFKFVKGFITQYNEIIDKICIKLNKFI